VQLPFGRSRAGSARYCDRQDCAEHRLADPGAAAALVSADFLYQMHDSPVRRATDGPRREQIWLRRRAHGKATTASTWTAAPSGSPATCTVVRAGYGSVIGRS
jgi:hypothetical protein